MPTIYNGSQSPLEAAAIAARNRLIAMNNFNNASPANNYSSTHTRAVSDNITPTAGKGSGGFLDVDNYSGVGDDYDKNGNQNLYAGSGRGPSLVLNSSTWGYGPTAFGMANYTAPDTSRNVGQVVL